jgi:carboxymethylenebutenolidase
MSIDKQRAVSRTPSLDPAVDSLLPHAALDRRTFIKAALGTGFAAAVLPVSAQTIHTSADGLEAGEIAVRAGNDWVPAYRAQPAPKPGQRRVHALPVIIVVHEIFGVHEHIADVCRRFAKLGYLAIAPNLYSREGDPLAYPTMQQLNAQLVSKVPDDQVMRDLDATVAWAGEHGGDLSRLGLTGFCWGGRIAWLYDEHNPRLKAVVAWYGRVAGAQDPLHPANPIDRVASLHAPLLGLYGGKDPSIPAESLERMRVAIATGPVGAEAARATQLIVYPDSPHAFFADYRPSYHKVDAEDGWRRCLAWFREHGVA